jgi:hypothetical protein
VSNPCPALRLAFPPHCGAADGPHLAQHLEQLPARMQRDTTGIGCDRGAVLSCGESRRECTYSAASAHSRRRRQVARSFTEESKGGRVFEPPLTSSPSSAWLSPRRTSSPSRALPAGYCPAAPSCSSRRAARRGISLLSSLLRAQQTRTSTSGGLRARQTRCGSGTRRGQARELPRGRARRSGGRY